MSKDQLAPVAEHLIASYFDTGSYSQRFRDDHDSPPSLMAKVHHLRSVIQARLVGDSAFELSPSYLDYGRVEFTDLQSGERFLLKSSRAVAIETSTARQQGGLFPIELLVRSARVQVLVYQFLSKGLELSLAPAGTRGRSEKIYVADTPVAIGVWPYHSGQSDDEQAKPFDQNVRDPFSDIGDLGHDERVGTFQ